MRKIASLTLGVSMLLLVSLLISNVFAAPPLPITNPGELIIATIEGGMPGTVDPAWVYDTASAEVMQNVYDTLVTFDGEHMDRYLPALATNWSITDITGTKTHMGIDLYYRYTFTIRTGVTFHNGNPLTTSDVEYSFERGMAQDRTYGPQWMFYEPLLYSWGSHAWDTDTETINNNTALASYVGNIIDDAVESDSKNVWFNIAFPGVYAPFMQILCQQWASILDQQWCTSNGRTDWSGDWGAGGGNHTEWVNYNDPELSPLDDPSPIMMGCGPFEYDTLDYTAKYWSVVRYEDYWRGWPADFPDVSTPNVQGYILRMTVTWAYVWEVRSTMFQQGDVDLCAVPRAHMDEVNNKDGIRLIWPLPQLSCDGMFYTFTIDPATPYGPILAEGTFAETGIPTDFFGNATWGVHVRKAFSYAFDYDSFLAIAYQNEGSQPATAIISTLPYHDASVQGFTFDLTEAENEFKQVPGLWDTGFTITILYNTGNLPRQTAAELLEDALEGMNTKFHVTVSSIDWRPYLTAAGRHQLAIYIIGWLADYPDAHNFAYAFYYTYGAFAYWQLYASDEMNALIEAGIAAPEDERAAIYHDIQVLAVEECPSVPILLPIGRHYERDWLVGWYYNPIYSGVYGYNLWKWYYVEESKQPSAAQPYSSLLPVDINYDGKVDMKDISKAAKGFGANYGPPVHPRWTFRCDFNNDRKIDMKDISRVAKNFGKSSAVWESPVPVPHDLAARLDAPAFINLTETPAPISITAGAKNQGTSDEASVTIELYANGSLLHSETVSLTSGNTHNFVYDWTPSLGTYTVEVKVLPVLGETIIFNNNIEYEVLVVD